MLPEVGVAIGEGGSWVCHVQSYFEKLVGIRDRRMEQLTEMITEKEKQNKDMEKIILELQEQS